MITYSVLTMMLHQSGSATNYINLVMYDHYHPSRSKFESEKSYHERRSLKGHPFNKFPEIFDLPDSEKFYDSSKLSTDKPISSL